MRSKDNIGTKHIIKKIVMDKIYSYCHSNVTCGHKTNKRYNFFKKQRIIRLPLSNLKSYQKYCIKIVK